MTEETKGVEEAVKEAQDKGYKGEVFDPHPNEDYTVSKVDSVDWSDVPENMAKVVMGTAEPVGSTSGSGGAKDAIMQAESQRPDSPQQGGQPQSQARPRK